jgi:prepilin-type N-terminal cleavage/methylation domain-containing protein
MRPRAHGFTLVELMVVLVLVGLLTAVIIPEMRGTYEDALLRSTGRKLSSALGLAYSQAVTVNLEHRLRIDLAEHRYTIETAATENQDGPGFRPLRDVPGGEGDLDPRISIEVRRSTPEDEAPPEPQGFSFGDEAPSANIEYIRFRPNGTTDPVEIILRDRDGFGLALRLNPITARVRIVEVERR